MLSQTLIKLNLVLMGLVSALCILLAYGNIQTIPHKCNMCAKLNYVFLSKKMRSIILSHPASFYKEYRLFNER